MKITPEQREAWAANTAKSPFNHWLGTKIEHANGTLDLEKLYEVAREYKVEKSYRHLNPGQQRMIIGNMLRSRVPASEYQSTSVR